MSNDTTPPTPAEVAALLTLARAVDAWGDDDCPRSQPTTRAVLAALRAIPPHLLEDEPAPPIERERQDSGAPYWAFFFADLTGAVMLEHDDRLDEYDLTDAEIFGPPTGLSFWEGRFATVEGLDGDFDVEARGVFRPATVDDLANGREPEDEPAQAIIGADAPAFPTRAWEITREVKLGPSGFKQVGPARYTWEGREVTEVELGALIEREACAVIADNARGYNGNADVVAAAIRARGSEKGKA